MYQWDKIKVIGNYDTVVVGVGTAGAAAGIHAARRKQGFDRGKEALHLAGRLSMRW